jgi:hypothetical protein
MGEAQFLLAVFRAASLRAAARPRTGRQIQANLVILAFAAEKRQTAVPSSRFPVASEAVKKALPISPEEFKP